ncbi:MAG TPA: TonB-dependent receptor [Bryobacteraceae bacterium]|nr:TonB-dependent receptor [Bryobacteraceae bacterium]
MLILLLALLAAGGLLPGQTASSTGSLQGTVRDRSGAAAPGVLVVVRNTDTATERRTATNDGGLYTFRGLLPGSYVLSASAPGFAGVQTAAFGVSVGQVLQRDLELAPAGLVERLEVNETPEAVDLTSSSASVAMGNERIEEAPARSRNYLNFVLAAPAVAPSAGTSSQRTMTGTRTALGDSGFTSGGLRPRNNAILIDGMDNRDEATGGNRVAVGLEMVQEFRVATASFGAELGGAAGGLLNMVTRSGVNLWHGDATFFGQNEITNAQRSEVGSTTRPRFRRYQPGVSALGPLRENRTFVAGAVEHERESAEEWSNVAEEVAAQVPGAYRGLYPTSTRGTELSLKLNHHQGERDTFAARYAFSHGRTVGEVQGPENFADRSAQGNSRTTDHSLVGNWLRVITPSLVNDVRVQAAERISELTPNGTGPLVEIPGVLSMGVYPRFDSARTERHYQIIESFSASFGRHRISVGGDAHWVRLRANMKHRYHGLFVFPTLADWRAGRPDLYIQAFGDPATRMTTAPLGAWVQDRWQVHPRLLLEIGGRWDRQWMPDGISSSGNNVSPRVGVAWRPSGRRPFVVRAGFGLFYDRYPLAWLNDALQKDGRQGFEQYGAGPDALLAWKGPRGVPLAGLASLTYRTATEFPATYSRKWSAGWEYGFGRDTSLSVEANAIRGFHLPRTRKYVLEQTGRSDYKGVAVTLNRRLTKELAYLATYNWGQTYDDGSDFDEQPSDPREVGKDWARSRQHQTHRAAISALFEFPWLVERLTIAPIFTVGTGRPVNALLTTDPLRTGAYPITARPPGVGRNPALGPGPTSLDLRVMKTFPLWEERAVLQFGVESFNLTNHTNAERLSPYVGITSYRGILESLPGRQVQFLVQFEY